MMQYISPSLQNINTHTCISHLVSHEFGKEHQNYSILLCFQPHRLKRGFNLTFSTGVILHLEGDKIQAKNTLEFSACATILEQPMYTEGNLKGIRRPAITNFPCRSFSLLIFWVQCRFYILPLFSRCFSIVCCHIFFSMVSFCNVVQVYS